MITDSTVTPSAPCFGSLLTRIESLVQKYLRSWPLLSLGELSEPPTAYAACKPCVQLLPVNPSAPSLAASYHCDHLQSWTVTDIHPGLSIGGKNNILRLDRGWTARTDHEDTDHLVSRPTVVRIRDHSNVLRPEQ